MRPPPPPPRARIGLLGGSFNPAHGGHLHVSREALRRLGLDAVWWLVSPGNPLKHSDAMAPLPARLASASRVAARDRRVRATAIETLLQTRYTVDTVAALRRCYPATRFVWLMGADNLMQFHRWRRWRELARAVPIAVFARPNYGGGGRIAPAMGWLRRFGHPSERAREWAEWRLPAIVVLPIRLDPTSATAIRARDPRWAERLEAPTIGAHPAATPRPASKADPIG